MPGALLPFGRRKFLIDRRAACGLFARLAEHPFKDYRIKIAFAQNGRMRARAERRQSPQTQEEETETICACCGAFAKPCGNIKCSRKATNFAKWRSLLVSRACVYVSPLPASLCPCFAGFLCSDRRVAL